ncbi:hypothetical protein HMPREF1039_1200 [Megasphaera lornae]|uniref:Uncharacterized protein n=1 Tax=Megasphaera lornae TaxID=1000568 RepID=A0ABN0D075_9FIRM|nr:hypothetical protein HMPREF1039_1200 [Megasphaera lornae]
MQINFSSMPIRNIYVGSTVGAIPFCRAASAAIHYKKYVLCLIV